MLIEGFRILIIFVSQNKAPHLSLLDNFEYPTSARPNEASDTLRVSRARLSFPFDAATSFTCSTFVGCEYLCRYSHFEYSWKSRKCHIPSNNGTEL